MENEKKTDSREWELDAETEYRFELDPGTSLAIKVRQALGTVSKIKSLSARSRTS